MRDYNNQSLVADVQGLAASNETTETGTMSNVQVIMKCKRFKVEKGEVLVIQGGKWVEFYMSYATSNYYFCTDYKAKIKDITERDAIRICNQFSDKAAEDDHVMMSYYLENTLMSSKKKRGANPGRSEQRQHRQ